MTSKATNKFSPQVRERAARLELDEEATHASRLVARQSVAGFFGLLPQPHSEGA